MGVIYSVCIFVFIVGLVYICGYCIRIITMLLVRSDVRAGNSTSVNGCTLSLACISIFESAVSEINWFDLI